MNNNSSLDPQVVALAKAIRQQESGGNYNAIGDNGTSAGAFQWSNNGKPLAQGQAPENFKSAAQKFIGNANVPFDEAHQKAVAYAQIKEWKDQGLNPAQIAAKWNSGSEKGWENKIGTTILNGKSIKYDVPSYVKNVTNYYQQFKNEGLPQQAEPQPTQSGGIFAASPTDTALQAGGKTLGNLIPSAFNFVKGAIETPLKGLAHIGEIPGAISDLAHQDAGGSSKLGNLASGLYESVVPQAGRQLLSGDLQGAQQSITNDPVGQIAPFLLAGEGVAKGIDTATAGLQSGMDVARTMVTKEVTPTRGAFQGAYGDAISNTAKLAEPVTNAASAVTGKTAGLLGAVTKSAASHLTGLDTQTISKILENPEAFTKLQQDQIARGGLAEEFGGAIDKLESRLDETGSGYEPVKSMQGLVAIPENFFEESLNKFGLKLIKEGDIAKVIADTTSATRNASDINAVQKFVNDWGGKTTLTPAEYLNMRSDLADLANYDKLTGMGKTKTSQVIADSIRQEANRTIRPQIPGLKELDAQYSPLIQQFKQIKKDFLIKDGEGGYTFKDGAINKIANATGVGKDALLSRMEELMPGVTKRIQLLKAVEDIERAKGIKVGAYGRAAVEGFALAGGVGTVVAAIISSPSIAVPLLRGLGWSGARVGQVVGTLKTIAGDVNHLTIPQTNEKGIPSPYTVVGASASVKK